MRVICLLALLTGLLFGLSACQTDTSVGRSGAVAGQAKNDAHPMLAVTYSRQPMRDRQAGVERMLEEDAALFWANAARLTRQIDDWPMIRLLCEQAEAMQDESALPWLVRSWAMPSKLVSDDDRPERDAIESITSGDAVELIHQIVFDSASDHNAATQLAAWSVLVRVVPAQTLRGEIAMSPDTDKRVLLSMLRRTAPVVDVLPSDRQSAARALRLMAVYPLSDWEAWKQWRDERTDGGPAKLALRHLPMLQHRDPQRDGWTRDQWQHHVAQRLAGRRHVTRGGSDEQDIVIRERPGRYVDHADRLGIADLIVLDQLLSAMQDPTFRRAAFQQAEADRLDTTTEYGGAISWDEKGVLVMESYEPMIRRHDQAYIASTSCLEAVYSGLAHYHFHTQKHDNADWAGPGQGDLDFADAHHANAIVYTYIDRNTLNVDAYFPGGIAIDLGCMTR